MTDESFNEKIRILIGEEDFSLNVILSNYFQKEGWLVETTQSGLHICRIVVNFHPDIILMDIDLPDRDGFAMTSILRRDLSQKRELPIILSTAFPNKDLIIKAKNAGCTDFILKPYKFALLKSKMEKYITAVNKNESKGSASYNKKEHEAEIIVYSREALKKAYSNAKEGYAINKAAIKNCVNKMVEILTEEKTLPLAYQMKSFNDYTYIHSINVAALCMSFAFHLKWDVRDIKILGEGGFLFDIGKTKIDINILVKSGKLTDAEFDEIKKHPVIGSELTKKQNFSEEISKMILEHHESIDGSGYPNKLSNEQISKYAKLISIVDSYDSMTTDTSYRKAMDSTEVIELMSKLPDFDKELFKNFKTLVLSNIIGK